MTIYTCNKCSKIFIRKQELERHMERKFSCINEVNRCIQGIPQTSSVLPQNSSVLPQKSSVIPQKKQDGTREDKPLVCKYCEKEYTRSDNLKRHEEQYCKKKREIEITEVNKISKMEEKDKIIEEQNKIIERLSRRAKVENINNGTINNTTNNIVVQFKDDCNIKRFLTEMEKLQIMRKGGLAPNLAFKTLFYNPSKPELHNAYASDTKLNKMMIYNGKKFIMANYTETLQTMINNIINCVEQIYEEIEETDEDIEKYKNVKKLLDKLNNNQNKLERNETMEMIVGELKNEPYNCRELILKTHKGMSVITI